MGAVLLRRRPKTLSPSFVARDINHVLMSGQSLSIGTQGTPALSTTQPYSNLMFNPGVRAGGSGLTSFSALIESDSDTEGETIASGMSSLATEMAQDLGDESHVLLMSAHGVGSSAYTALKKGTTPYSNGMAQVTAGKIIAAGDGLSHVVRAVMIVHGETDAANHNSTYAADVTEWQADYDADVKAITEQSDPVVMFHSQMSASWIVGGDGTIPIQQLAASVASGGKIVMVCPKYIFPYADNLHLTNEGYRWLGEYYAKAYRRVILEALPWEPVRPLSIVRSANVIDVRFAVPVRPLVLDTERVADPGNYGFVYTDDSSPPAITSVALTGPNSLRITLATMPSGANQRLRYAYNNGNFTGPETGDRGCLRDSDATESRHGSDLFNWCVHFDEPVTT